MRWTRMLSMLFPGPIIEDTSVVDGVEPFATFCLLGFRTAHPCPIGSSLSKTSFDSPVISAPRRCAGIGAASFLGITVGFATGPEIFRSWSYRILYDTAFKSCRHAAFQEHMRGHPDPSCLEL